MAVNLIIDGTSFELQGAATEETLHRLVEKMEAKGEKSTDDFKKAGDQIVQLAKGTGTATHKLSGLAEKSDDASRELDKAADAASSFSSRAGSFVKKLIDGATSVVQFGSQTAGVGYNLETMGKNAEGVLSAFPKIGTLLGAAGGAMIGHAANLQDTFRGLSGTGAMFTNSFFELERTAANSYMSLAEMTSVIRSNSEALAAFGGSTRLGAKRFAEMNMVMQNTYRQELREFGLSAGEGAEMLAIFTAANARNMNFSTLSTQQQAAAGANFAKEMTLLASLTGQDRKAMAQKLASDQRRSDVELKMSRMGTEAQSRARQAFTALETQFGANSPVLEAFRAKFLGQDVVIGNPAANMLLTGSQPIGAALNDVASKLSNGSISIDQVVKTLAGSAQAQIDANKNLEATAPFNAFSMEMTNISAGALKLAKMQETVNTKFDGNFKAFLDASNQPELDKASKAIIGASMLAEDIGKNTRLLFNSLTETTVTGIADGVKMLKDALAGMTAEELSKLNTASTGATGAVKGFAEALKLAAKNMAITAGTTIDDIAKVGTVAATATAPAGTKVATGLAGATKAMSTFLGKLPMIGALITGGVTASETGSVVEGIGAGGGSLGGGAAGAAIGTLILPGVGTVLGGILGSFIGEAIGQGVTSGGERFGSIGKLFGFEEGGIVRQPTLAMIGEGRSDEAVVPLDNNRNVPVNMDMSAIEKLAQKIDRLAEASGAGGYDPTMTMEMRKFNRNAEKMVRLLQ